MMEAASLDFSTEVAQEYANVNRGTMGRGGCLSHTETDRCLAPRLDHCEEIESTGECRISRLLSKPCKEPKTNLTARGAEHDARLNVKRVDLTV
jgi:hypothetical protein